MKKECFIFTSDENKYGSIYKVLLNDVLSKDNVFYIDKTFVYNNWFFNGLKKILFSTILNIKTKEKIAKKARKALINKYALKRIIDRASKDYEIVNVVLFNASIKRFYSAKVLENFKSEHNNVKYNLFFMDPSTIWASQNAMQIIENNESLFNNIFTVDSDDAKNKGWIFWPTPYSKIKFNDIENKQDIYFCGATKDRHKLLIKLKKTLQEKNIKTKFDVFYIKRKEKNLNELKSAMKIQKLSKMKTYEETLEDMVASNCILELVTPDQSATYTLRDYEAVVYNKKLLTNNKCIFDFPYYNDKCMKYFENASDIDYEWIKRKDQIDYQYKDDYSPLKLIEEISRINEER